MFDIVVTMCRMLTIAVSEVVSLIFVNFFCFITAIEPWWGLSGCATLELHRETADGAIYSVFRRTGMKELT
jgi:hypothetical protein